MGTAIIVFRLLAASQVVLFAFALATSENPKRIRVTGSTLVAGILCYLVAPLVVKQFGLSVAAPLWLMAAIIPGLLLLFVWALFEEHRPIPKWLIIAVAAGLAAQSWVLGRYIQSDPNPMLSSVLQALKIILIFMSLYFVWRDRESDLVEKRLRLRWAFIVTISLIILLVVSVELFTKFNVPAWIELFGMAGIFFCAFLMNAVFLRHNPRLQLIGPEVQVKDDSDDPQIRNLLKRMKDERLYADHNLRVGTLASLLGLPEYQLRKKINANLGYRNFNHFVNRYRIEEAARRLISDQRTPVLSIALEVGFRSISSFNNAFHAHFGVTPTSYRSQPHSDS